MLAQIDLPLSLAPNDLSDPFLPKDLQDQVATDLAIGNLSNLFYYNLPHPVCSPHAFFSFSMVVRRPPLYKQKSLNSDLAFC